MDQLAVEKKLAVSYTLCAIAGAVASITMGITWGHWYHTLDKCIGKNCSCILYGLNTPSTFLGGDQAPCIWVTFGPLIYVFCCICLTCFHGYRVLFTTKAPRMTTTRTVIAKTEPGEAVRIQTIAQEDISPLPRTFWIVVSAISVFFFVYALVHFSIFLDGFYSTCTEYRKVLEILLGVDGTALPVIHGRLYCQGIFDFMDYMQLDSVNASRNGFLNTGLALVLGVIASAFSWIVFLFASWLNILMTRRRD
ncbi:uncharacterized protein LOC132698281 [Cylas formicarius]|uniref:uncharacterized protein LOC132698281 n=1 Tax=Cylas formicarius TaxID=197179 RepID=UPI00295883ED|nr:uncharacterized protein LOC132698281 [Cylas formicarius]